MNREALVNPEDLLHGFFGSYTPEHAKALLWDMLAQTLSVSDDELGSFSRKELLAGYEALERLVDAAFKVYLREPTSFPPR